VLIQLTNLIYTSLAASPAIRVIRLAMSDTGDTTSIKGRRDAIHRIVKIASPASPKAYEGRKEVKPDLTTCCPTPAHPITMTGIDSATLPPPSG
jgi:hypothetical protein